MGWHKHRKLLGHQTASELASPMKSYTQNCSREFSLSLHTLVHLKDFPTPLEKAVLPTTHGKFLLHKGNPILKPLPSNEASRVLIGFIRV